MAKVVIKNLFKIKNSIKKQINLAIFQTIREEKIGEDIAEIVKTTNREGIDPSTSMPHAKLAESTIDRRKKLSRFNQPHETFIAAKSNLTLTGRLIDGIKSFARPARSVIEVKVTGTHERYTGTRGKKIGKNIRNEKINTELGKQGRNLLGVGEYVKPKIIKLIKEKLIKLLRRK